MKQSAVIGMIVAALCLDAGAIAQEKAAKPAAPMGLSNDKPIEVSSNTLEVQQDKHIAIFTGNVIAVQGVMNMRADQMIVHYNNDDAAKPGEAPKPKPAPKPAAAKGSPTDGANGISQIDSTGHVIFTNPTDTAKGDFATYNVAGQTLDLTGVVTLTRDKNILKGTHMHYDLATSRSTLTAGDVPVSDTGGVTTGGGRVHGLFVPNAKPKPAN